MGVLPVGRRPRKKVTNPLNRPERMDIRPDSDMAIRVTVTSLATHRNTYGWVRNINAGGMYVVCPQGFPAETEVLIRGFVREGQSLLRLRMNGWVARVDPDGMGLQFDRLTSDMAAAITRIVETLSLRNGVCAGNPTEPPDSEGELP